MSKKILNGIKKHIRFTYDFDDDTYVDVKQNVHLFTMTYKQTLGD